MSTGGESKKRKLNEEGYARVFVGNLPLPHHIRPQETFAQWFESMLRDKATETERKAREDAGVAVDKFVDGIENWSVDEGICVVRLLHRDDVWIALRLSGTIYEGMPLSVCIPQMLPERIYQEAPMLQVDPLPNLKPHLAKWRGKYIVFAEMPGTTSEADIRALFEALGGPIENLTCYKENGFFKGCGRLSLVNNLIIESVVQRLNNAPVGTKIMRIAAFLPDNRRLPTVNGIAPMSFDGVDETMPTRAISAQMFSDPIICMQLRAGRLMGGRPTRIVQLHNVVKIEDLLCEELRQQLLADVRKEAVKYGKLESIVAPTPLRAGAIHSDAGCGKVFVEYADLTSARRAQFEFNGRHFENRVVCAAFYPLLPFQLKQYSLLVP